MNKLLVGLMLIYILTLVVFTSKANANANAVSCEVDGVSLAHCANSWEQIFNGGNKLIDPQISYESGYFDGYVLGISLSQINKTWCPITEFSTDQITGITAKFLRENPDKWHERPINLVTNAVSDAFPCAKNLTKHKTKPLEAM